MYASKPGATDYGQREKVILFAVLNLITMPNATFSEFYQRYNGPALWDPSDAKKSDVWDYRRYAYSAPNGYGGVWEGAKGRGKAFIEKYNLSNTKFDLVDYKMCGTAHYVLLIGPSDHTHVLTGFELFTLLSLARLPGFNETSGLNASLWEENFMRGARQRLIDRLLWRRKVIKPAGRGKFCLNVFVTVCCIMHVYMCRGKYLCYVCGGASIVPRGADFIDTPILSRSPVTRRGARISPTPTTIA